MLNESLLPLIMDDDVKMISVVFNDSKRITEGDTDGAKNYSYLTRLDLKVGDRVVVGPNGGYKVAYVTDTDVIPKTNDPREYFWVVDRVDLERYGRDISAADELRRNYAGEQLKRWKEGMRQELALSHEAERKSITADA